MKTRSRHNSTKNGFMMFFFTVTLRLFSSTTHPSYFPSHNITKNAETHPPSMLDLIIEQPLKVAFQLTFIVNLPFSKITLISKNDFLLLFSVSLVKNILM